MARIRVTGSRQNYAVTIAQDLLRGIAKNAHAAGKHCIVISAAPVFALWGEELLRGFPRTRRPEVLLHPDGERAKSMREFASLHSQLAQCGARRDSIILALGGGVTGDLAGFVAATYMRGISYINIPTTLLAQVDSSIGGKTAVDIPQGKNLVGAFHPPVAVFADTRTFATLPRRQLRAGIYECIKTAVLGDASLFQYLERNNAAILAGDTTALQHVVIAAARVKAGIVSRDERESGERILLNLGHTFGHAIETTLGYKRLLHGEAVAWGMLAALHASCAANILDKQGAARIRALILSFGALPRVHASRDGILAALARDKKHTHARQRFIVVRDIGHAEVFPLQVRLVRNAVDAVLAEAAR